jgi:hypothetical protein
MMLAGCRAIPHADLGPLLDRMTFTSPRPQTSALESGNPDDRPGRAAACRQRAAGRATGQNNARLEGEEIEITLPGRRRASRLQAGSLMLSRGRIIGFFA